MLMASIALIGKAGISEVSAEPPKIVTSSSTPLIYIYPNYSGPLDAGTTKTFQVRISSVSGKGAPHQTTEPTALSTDKTYAYEVIITFDPYWINVTTLPTRHASRDWFNTFHLWYWDEFEWLDEGAYDTAYAKNADNEEGWVRAWCSLIGDPCTTTPLPVDDMDEHSFPNAWLHAGDNYDLPYTDGISTSSLTGGWSGDYFVLFYFRVTVKEDIPTPPTVGGSSIHINETRLWMFDKTTLYPANTQDGMIGQPPAVPEFPLGIEIIMIIALLTPIIYLWRRKRWKK